MLVEVSLGWTDKEKTQQNEKAEVRVEKQDPLFFQRELFLLACVLLFPEDSSIL